MMPSRPKFIMKSLQPNSIASIVLMSCACGVPSRGGRRPQWRAPTPWPWRVADEGSSYAPHRFLTSARADFNSTNANATLNELGAAARHFLLAQR
jgi:hypothetical protein